MTDLTIFDERESDVRVLSRLFPAVFATAQNEYLFDEKGKAYLDFFAGAGVVNFGHNNPKMTQAVIDYIQANGVIHSLDMQTTAKRDFMTRFSQVILEPKALSYKIQFTGPTGTNAVEAALKLARKVMGRQRVIAFEGGFHGLTLGALSTTSNLFYRRAAGVVLTDVTHLLFGTEANLSDAIQQLDDFAEQCVTDASLRPAAFIVETIQAEGGVNVADAQWLQAVAQVAKQLGALLIVDDVQAGIGRTGAFFSFENVGIEPDIVCLAKALGGFGTPMAMNLVKPEFDQYWLPGEHAGTFRGQNLSFVAAQQALSYFETTELMQQVTAMEAIIIQRFSKLTKRFPQLSVRGRGLLMGLDMVDGNVAKLVQQQCFEQGLLIAPCGPDGRVLKLIPPLTITTEALQTGLQLIIEVIEQELDS